MDKSETIAELAKALSLAQGEIRGAEMNATNPFLKNKYADLGSIIEAARPALTKHGLSFTQLVGGDANNITLETMLLHASGQYISQAVSLPVGDDKGRSLAQNAGAIITYLRRYALAAMLGVYADEDTDGQPQQKPAPKTHQPEPQSTAPITLDEARAMKTAKGTELGTLGKDQLQLLIDKYPSGAPLHIAARIILDTWDETPETE